MPLLACSKGHCPTCKAHVEISYYVLRAPYFCENSSLKKRSNLSPTIRSGGTFRVQGVEGPYIGVRSLPVLNSRLKILTPHDLVMFRLTRRFATCMVLYVG